MFIAKLLFLCDEVFGEEPWSNLGARLRTVLTLRIGIEGGQLCRIRIPTSLVSRPGTLCVFSNKKCFLFTDLTESVQKDAVQLKTKYLTLETPTAARIRQPARRCIKK